MTPSSSTEFDKILSDVASAVTAKPTTIKISIVNPTWKEKLLIRLGKLKPYREFDVRPLTYGKLMQISEIMLRIDTSVVNLNTPHEGYYTLMKGFRSTYAEVLSIALTPGRTPSKDIRNFIIDNVTPNEGFALCSLIAQKLDMANFLASIGVLGTLKILKNPPSPQDQEETIAPGILSDLP